jgi:hypothetical protein
MPVSAFRDFEMKANWERQGNAHLWQVRDSLHQGVRADEREGGGAQDLTAKPKQNQNYIAQLK